MATVVLKTTILRLAPYALHALDKVAQVRRQLHAMLRQH
jgi:hypothetical protein